MQVIVIGLFLGIVLVRESPHPPVSNAPVAAMTPIAARRFISSLAGVRRIFGNFHQQVARPAPYCCRVRPLGLFLLPGGRPRRFGADAAATHDGGRPRPLPCPDARRSRTTMASSICVRCWRRSVSIFKRSICRKDSAICLCPPWTGGCQSSPPPTHAQVGSRRCPIAIATLGCFSDPRE